MWVSVDIYYLVYTISFQILWPLPILVFQQKSSCHHAWNPTFRYIHDAPRLKTQVFHVPGPLSMARTVFKKHVLEKANCISTYCRYLWQNPAGSSPPLVKFKAPGACLRNSSWREHLLIQDCSSMYKHQYLRMRFGRAYGLTEIIVHSPNSVYTEGVLTVLVKGPKIDNILQNSQDACSQQTGAYVCFREQKLLRRAHRPRGGGLTSKIQVQKLIQVQTPNIQI